MPDKFRNAVCTSWFMRIFVPLFFIVALGGCGNNGLQLGFTQPGVAAPGQVLISLPIAANSSTTLQPGQSVTWQNLDSTAHTTTSTTGEWDSGAVTSDGTFSHTFTTTGTFNYFCQIHPNETGSVQVQAPTTSPSPAPFPLPTPGPPVPFPS